MSVPDCPGLSNGVRPYRDYTHQVRQACSNAGVPIIYIAFYLRYGHEIWQLVNQRFLSGDLLASEVASRAARWAKNGLDLAVLQSIHYNVFNVAIPTGP